MVDIAGVKTIVQARNPPIATANPIKISRAIHDSQKNVTISNKILFDDIDKHKKTKFPSQQQEVDIYEQGLLFGRTKIATRKTNALGQFAFNFERSTGFFARDRHFTYEFVAKPQPFSSYGLSSDDSRVTQIYNFSVPKDLVSADFELHAEYADQPLSLAAVAPPPTTHWQSINYFLRLTLAILPVLPKALFVAVFGRWMTGSQVQWVHDLYGAKHPKVDLSPEFLIDNLLNGICQTDYGQYDDLISWTADWSGIEFDTANALPNVRVVANLVKNNQGKKELKLERIEIEYREDSEPEIIFANNTKELRRAVYIALSVFALKGEAEGHLGEGHILPGLASVPFFKFINKDNPLYAELAWALNEVQFINFLGSLGIIFGIHSILDSSAFSAKGVEQVILNHLKTIADWKYRNHCSDPINHQDHFNAGQMATHELLLAYYKSFVEANKGGLTAHWGEIRKWTQAINERLPESPVVHSFNDLVEFLTFYVPKTTFIHWAKHSRQAPLLNIHQMSLGLRGRCKDLKGQFSPDGNTTAEDASRQLFIASVLMNFNSPSLVDNPFGDIPAKLVALFKANYHKFVGYPDIQKMMGGTRI